MSFLAKDAVRFVETEIEQETVVMLLESGTFFSLAGTAQAIWRLIDGTRDRQQIVQALAADYHIPEQRIAQEVNDFLGELSASGLLRQN